MIIYHIQWQNFVVFFVDWNQNEYVKKNNKKKQFFFLFFFRYFLLILLVIVVFFVPFFQINTIDWGESRIGAVTNDQTVDFLLLFLKAKSAYHTLVIESKPQQFTEGEKNKINLIHDVWCWYALTPGFRLKQQKPKQIFLFFSLLRRSIFNSLKICSPH